MASDKTKTSETQSLYSTKYADRIRDLASEFGDAYDGKDTLRRRRRAGLMTFALLDSIAASEGDSYDRKSAIGSAVEAISQATSGAVTSVAEACTIAAALEMYHANVSEYTFVHGTEVPPEKELGLNAHPHLTYHGVKMVAYSSYTAKLSDGEEVTFRLVERDNKSTLERYVVRTELASVFRSALLDIGGGKISGTRIKEFIASEAAPILSAAKLAARVSEPEKVATAERARQDRIVAKLEREVNNARNALVEACKSANKPLLTPLLTSGVVKRSDLAETLGCEPVSSDLMASILVHSSSRGQAMLALAKTMSKSDASVFVDEIMKTNKDGDGILNALLSAIDQQTARKLAIAC